MMNKNSLIKVIVNISIIVYGIISSCSVPTYPLTHGPTNIKKNEKEIYLSLSSYFISNYDTWNQLGTEGYSEFINALVGMKYGLSDRVNVSGNFWLSIASEIGIAPKVSLQILDGNQKLNLSLNSGVAGDPFGTEGYDISLFVNSDLIWGPTEYFFLGLRYDYKNYLKNVINDIVWEYNHVGVFLGSEYKAMKKATPFVMYKYEVSSEIWQVNVGVLIRWLK